MEFLDKLVLPQSAEHIKLLHFILILLFFLYIPFISVLFGSTVLSLYYKIRGTSESNLLFTRFSRDIIETLTINKSIGIIIGIVPVLTSVLILTQLLHTTGSGTVALFAAAFIFDALGIILVYTYRYSFSIHEVFESLKDYKADDNVHHEIRRYRETTGSLRNKSVIYGLIFLFISIWLIVTGLTLAVNPQMWKQPEVYYHLFSVKVLSRLIYFMAGAFAITGGAILFSFFYWEGGKQGLDESYKAFVRSTAIKITFISAVIIPLFLLINILIMPVGAYSRSVFLFASAALILLFFAYNFLYAMLKETNNKYSGALFYMILAALLAVVVQDQVALANSTRVQTAVLSAKYDQYIATLKGTGEVVKVSGEEIFTVRCSSCHSFDHKVVGPPYKETMPKYEGKINDLVGFILNPSKVNPAYPPMPNPGLKPNEAKAVAEYILKTYKTK